MANPSPAAIAWIEAKITDWTQTDAALAQSINAAMVANPVPQPTIPVPPASSTMFGVLSDATAEKLLTFPSLVQVMNDVDSGVEKTIMNWISVLVKGGYLTSEDVTALEGQMAATEPDPSWQAQIPEPLAALGRLLDTEDVVAARLAGGH